MTTVFNNLVATIQTKTAEAVVQTAQNVRIAALFSTAVAGIVGALFTSFALTAASSTYGFSIIMLAPAAVLFLVSFESYKIMRCADIVLARAQTNEVGEAAHSILDAASTFVAGTPLWAQRLKKEIDDTLILRAFLNRTVY